VFENLWKVLEFCLFSLLWTLITGSVHEIWSLLIAVKYWFIRQASCHRLQDATTYNLWIKLLGLLQISLRNYDSVLLIVTESWTWLRTIAQLHAVYCSNGVHSMWGVVCTVEKVTQFLRLAGSTLCCRAWNGSWYVLLSVIFWLCVLIFFMYQWASFQSLFFHISHIWSVIDLL